MRVPDPAPDGHNHCLICGQYLEYDYVLISARESADDPDPLEVAFCPHHPLSLSWS